VFELSKPQRFKRNLALASSFLAHGLLIVFWLTREPIFVKPSSVAWGREGKSGTLIYLPPRTEIAKNSRDPKLHYKAHAKPLPLPEPVPRESARAGTSTGSLSSGPATGVEATPALPLVFPDPDVYPWQVRDLQGDVVVEITIDEKGLVSKTKLLQSLKQEIDEKCIAAVRNWRFRPAMIDGVAIASRQDVHFHYPG
jgi:TonB family protein